MNEGRVVVRYGCTAPVGHEIPVDQNRLVAGVRSTVDHQSAGPTPLFHHPLDEDLRPDPLQTTHGISNGYRAAPAFEFHRQVVDELANQNLIVSIAEVHSHRS